jgi:hypothetical protein
MRWNDRLAPLAKRTDRVVDLAHNWAIDNATPNAWMIDPTDIAGCAPVAVTHVRPTKCASSRAGHACSLATTTCPKTNADT